ncbi:OsmC family protein [Pontibacter sp. BT310]|jgi:putative redox protein|uniref:OsmC family protein n=1 Tax=Pontibacter populi TaxID=890055 RepID=A0ABS6XAA6_9BACT|nr:MULTISPECIES: OsmC family protein [Pontibacter]MBJ6118080.1 OsmC family protein [Pontibacter sp. BT310]MBR0570507.1 OsmC family protein [Microvirga sp. STS03]MBW3364933.1 OsmC family protein [Pontibacter populi]
MSRTVTISAEQPNGLVANIQMGDQQFSIDESGIAEGIDTGPTPYDYIMSALGACTVITLHMYAQRKQWPLQRAEVVLSHERVYAADCEQCDDKSAKISQITKKLKLVGDLTQEQRLRLEIISSKCPVQKTLQAGIVIQTELVNG